MITLEYVLYSFETKNSNYYQQAISYYETALLKEPSLTATLRYELAELYFKLKNYEDAERVAKKALDHPKSMTLILIFFTHNLLLTFLVAEDMTVLSQDVKLHVLLARSYKAMQGFDKAALSFIKARECQMQLVFKYFFKIPSLLIKFYISVISLNGNSEGKDLKMIASDICFELAEVYKNNLKNLEKALSYYNESIQHNSLHKKVKSISIILLSKEPF
jgi:tetratricopeptide (TPR) repeat protein